jgi:hypothetical protein
MPDYFNPLHGTREPILALHSEITANNFITTVTITSLVDEVIPQNSELTYFRTIYNESIRGLSTLNPSRIHQFRENVNYLPLIFEPVSRTTNIFGFEISIYSILNLFSPAVLSFLAINLAETGGISYAILTFFLGLSRPLFLSGVNIRFWAQNSISSVISIFYRITRTIQNIRLNDTISPTFYRNLFTQHQSNVTQFIRTTNTLSTRLINITNRLLTIKKWRRFFIRSGFLALLGLLISSLKNKDVICFLLRQLENFLPNGYIFQVISQQLHLLFSNSINSTIIFSNSPTVSAPVIQQSFFNNFDQILPSVIEYMIVFMQ